MKIFSVFGEVLLDQNIGQAVIKKADELSFSDLCYFDISCEEKMDKMEKELNSDSIDLRIVKLDELIGLAKSRIKLFKLLAKHLKENHENFESQFDYALNVMWCKIADYEEGIKQEERKKKAVENAGKNERKDKIMFYVEGEIFGLEDINLEEIAKNIKSKRMLKQHEDLMRSLNK